MDTVDVLRHFYFLYPSTYTNLLILLDVKQNTTIYDHFRQLAAAQ